MLPVRALGVGDCAGSGSASDWRCCAMATAIVVVESDFEFESEFESESVRDATEEGSSSRDGPE
jgi:hypothetical protein